MVLIRTVLLTPTMALIQMIALGSKMELAWTTLLVPIMVQAPKIDLALKSIDMASKTIPLTPKISDQTPTSLSPLTMALAPTSMVLAPITMALALK